MRGLPAKSVVSRVILGERSNHPIWKVHSEFVWFASSASENVNSKVEIAALSGGEKEGVNSGEDMCCSNRRFIQIRVIESEDERRRTIRPAIVSVPNLEQSVRSVGQCDDDVIIRA
jgi:hypothetical protein